MHPEPVCLLCGDPTLEGMEFHDLCRPEAQRYIDVVLEMARRKYGPHLNLSIVDVPGQYPEVFPAPVGGIIGGYGEVLGGPPIGPEPLSPENQRNLDALKAKADAAEFEAKPVCLCEKDADNRCPKCIDTICTHVKGLMELLKEQMERQSKLKSVDDVCDACTRDYSDYSLAKIVREVFGPMLEYAGSEFKPTIRELIRAMKGHFERKGTRAWPLLDKAAAELFRGPPPDEFVA